jgi:hypothetical protein
MSLRGGNARQSGGRRSDMKTGRRVRTGRNCVRGGRQLSEWLLKIEKRSGSASRAY